ncbi:MAG: hypothetical protein FJ319_10155 [SAR202 cluster bacterium]|nr:hypothetical protein [SAR202 cluster bacterium]
MFRLKSIVLMLLVSLSLLAVACDSPSPSPTATSAPAAQPTATVAAATATAVVPTAVPTPSLFPYRVTDSDGKEVVFDKAPERIVSIDSAPVEILFAIGEGDRIVGTHDFITYPPETADIAKVGSAFGLNVEQIVALKPDLVFIFSQGNKEALEKAGLKVLYLKSLNDDFRAIPDSIRMWGRITGSVDASETVAADFESRLKAIEAGMSTRGDGPRAFQDEGDLWTPGPDTLTGAVFRLLKLQNIAYDVSGYYQMSPETIVSRNPQVIVASYGDTISKRPGMEKVDAVVNSRIYIPDDDSLSVPGTRYISGVEKLAKWVYPDLALAGK